MVPRLRKHVLAVVTDEDPQPPLTPKVDLKERAAAIAMMGFGPAAASEQVGTINLAMLALLTYAQPPTWLVRPSASRIVHETDLHSIPTIAPRLLRRPGIVETRRPETGERLWGDIASLGWYAIGDTYWLIGLAYPDGYFCVRWSPRWSGEDLDEQLPAIDPSALVSQDRQSEYYDFAHQAARYLIVLGLLAESDPTPLRIVIDKSQKERQVRDVYLGPGALDKPPPSRDPSMPDRLLEGRHAAEVPVRGHLKRQRYGEGNAKVKWIYVQGFSARRWLAPRWLVSEVGSGEDVRP